MVSLGLGARDLLQGDRLKLDFLLLAIPDVAAQRGFFDLRSGLLRAQGLREVVVAYLESFLVRLEGESVVRMRPDVFGVQHAACRWLGVVGYLALGLLPIRKLVRGFARLLGTIDAVAHSYSILFFYHLGLLFFRPPLLTPLLSIPF